MCQTHREKVQKETDFVQEQGLLRRQYVLCALRLSFFDEAEGQASSLLARWLAILDDVVEGYQAWSERVPDSPKRKPSVPPPPPTPKPKARPPPPPSPTVPPRTPARPSQSRVPDATPATPREPVVPPVSNDSEENPAPDCIRSDSNAPFISIAGTPFEDLTTFIYCDEHSSGRSGDSVVRYEGILNRGEEYRRVHLTVVRAHDESPAFLKRLVQGLHTWSSLRHRNILPILGMSQRPASASGLPALVSPWRESLGKYIDKRRNDDMHYSVKSLMLDLFMNTILQ
ncbi:hypothetical protein EXIGLDRAFT_382919 [Exidia glandulosa HHB12029]|uniref:Protein kinase domain-containing protein n=1 Tax=Exidia glandulosa HHB12029 TaxID=1314781 RepID=A0A165L268_EXIGL|nr:hypothetical protein EXIGLDRAFT_382919 [Exidia glandulosa HHB12029]